MVKDLESARQGKKETRKKSRKRISDTSEHKSIIRLCVCEDHPTEKRLIQRRRKAPFEWQKKNPVMTKSGR